MGRRYTVCLALSASTVVLLLFVWRDIWVPDRVDSERTLVMIIVAVTVDGTKDVNSFLLVQQACNDDVDCSDF